ncbi:hypothetical protein T492DRAFT_863725 [Pavlovales sp. CCMP2436]|nr:hypothetical protein T492DRAFT_863725 [Pavlovales sp. CCMP2436]
MQFAAYWALVLATTALYCWVTFSDPGYVEMSSYGSYATGATLDAYFAEVAVARVGSGGVLKLRRTSSLLLIRSDSRSGYSGWGG